VNDFFAIPYRDLDERVFVVSDMQATVEYIQGVQVIAFQGASEWALDNLITREVVWLPSEMQLRQRLEASLMESGRPEVRLVSGLAGCRCEFVLGDELFSFQALEASEAYAAALLYLLGR
jgi:hypothetical protein